MATLDSDIVALLSRRAYDIAGTTPGLSVFLNGKKITIKTFKVSKDRAIAIAIKTFELSAD